MSLVIQLSLLALFPVIVSIGFYLLNKFTKFNNIKKNIKQVIYVLVFGILAILGTELGVDLGGATANARDASVLIAGLVFGAPAGLIAGVIGGVERWFAVFWGAGEYTRLACSLSTILAGVIGAVLRKYMFDNKLPSWPYALAIGLVTEVLHMLMIFITNMNDIITSFNFVVKCSLPMILVNGLAVMFAVLFITLIGKGKLSLKKNDRAISTQFQGWLLLCVIFAIIITSTFTLFLQNSIAKSNTNSVLELNINDVKSDISDASNKNLIAITRKIATLIDAEAEITNDLLLNYATEHGIAEIDIINTKGIISLSTKPSFIGFDMASGSQSKEFLVLLNGTKEFVQSYQPTTYDATIYRKYGGVALDAGGFVQVGYNAEQFQKDLAETTKNITKNRHIGSTGCVIIVDKNMSLVSRKENYEGNVFNQSEFSGALPVNTKFFATVYNDKCYCMYDIVEGYYIIAALPVEEANLSRNLAIYITVFMELVVFVGLFILIYFLIKTLVVKNIQKVNASLAEITGGNLDVTVDVRTNEEFSSLSDDINSTVVTLKRYIAEAAARIDKELEFAKSIQHSALPSIFPPYPNRKDFDIYALMNPAKEVGGDFYDFYFTETNELVLIVADVSGKGIPGAMFMMRAKTLIKSLASTGIGVDEILTQANDNLCTGNDAEMFVTAWICKINCLTGHAEFSNAGHNPPLLKKFNEKAFYLPMKPGFVLGGMEGIHYKKFEFNLNPSDLLFVYTDGVTESTNEQNELYGEDRLIKAFEQNASKDVKKICNSIQTDVDKFVDVAPQFDDITMLCFQYHGNQIENKENK